jgi:hypothetical protein
MSAAACRLLRTGETLLGWAMTADHNLKVRNALERSDTAKTIIRLCSELAEELLAAETS